MSNMMKIATNELDIFMSRKRNACVFREGDMVGPIYQVEAGCVRLVKTTNCGKRCIFRFCFPGDLFGLGSQGPSSVDAEAACDSRISKMTASRLSTLMQDQPQRALAIIDAAHGGQGCGCEHFVFVSYGHADAKIAWFLNGLAARAPQTQCYPNSPKRVIELPMPRGDIADHLGMKLETVSRELSKLKDAGVITTSGFRRIVILNPRALLERAALDAHETRRASQVDIVCTWPPTLSERSASPRGFSDHRQDRLATTH